MMLKPHVLKVSAIALVASVLGFSSCKDDTPQRFTLQDTADLTDEAVTEAYFQDLDDMAGVAIETPSDAQYNAGRVSTSITIEDHRFNCDGIVVTVVPAETSNADHPKGVLTIDFGTAGCTDQKGNVRKGKLIFTYDGTRFMPGATVVTTTDNYSINGTRLDGVRTLTNLQNSTSEAPRFNVVLENGKAIFPNESFATRESDITWQWNRAENRLDDYLTIESTSSASGTTRGGRVYQVDILEDLIYKRHCGIAISGIKKYTLDGEKEITIDYGDGECDRAFTVTMDGVTRDITF
jgi:hypothetical protein